MNPENLIRLEEPPTATPGSTSQALLDRVRLGGDEDRGRLIAMYSPLVLNLYINRRVVEDPEDRNDIVGRVFVTVFRRIEKDGFEREARGAFRGWLKVITRHKVGDFIRRRRRRQARTNHLAELLGVAPHAEPDDELLTIDAASERALMVRQAMEEVRATFEPASYEMARLQLVDGLAALEAGKALGRTRSAAYIAKCRVKRRLREILGRFEIWDSPPEASDDAAERDHE